MESKEVAIEKRWTRILIDKRGPSVLGIVTEEVGLYGNEGRWASLSTKEHFVDSEALLLLMDLPLSALRLGKDQQTVGAVLNALSYGILTDQIPTTLKLAPVLMDQAGNAITNFTMQVAYPGGTHEVLTPGATIAPRQGAKVTIFSGGSMPYEAELPYVIGEWKPEITLAAPPASAASKNETVPE